MEPLMEAIQIISEIKGIYIGKIENRISLYADHTISYLTSPARSIPAVLKLMNKFGIISGYKINLAKSNAFLLNSPISSKLKIISPGHRVDWGRMCFPNLKTY